MILIHSPVHRRDLPLAKGTVQSRVDGLWINSEAGSRRAIDGEFGAQTIYLLITVHINQDWNRL